MEEHYGCCEKRAENTCTRKALAHYRCATMDARALLLRPLGSELCALLRIPGLLLAELTGKTQYVIANKNMAF